MKKNRKKLRYLFALFAVVLCMMALPLTAHAGGGGEEPPEEPPAEVVAPEPEPNPFIPPGTGTVVDTATDEDGKVFYTIMTPDEHVFYLVIDRQRGTENVYFLGAVTEEDLMALAIPSENSGGSAIPGGTVEPEPPAEPTPEPDPEPAPEEEKGGNMGMVIVVVLIVLAAGGAGYYFKVLRPKQLANTGDEYGEGEYDEQEQDEAPWPDDEDAPPWDEDEAREEYESDTGEDGDA